MDAGQRVEVSVSGPAVDSLGPRRVGQLGFTAATEYGVQRIEVSDQAVTQAHRLAWEQVRLGLEGGGATTLAAILDSTYTPIPGEVVGVVCSGGNVDISALLAGTI